MILFILMLRKERRPFKRYRKKAVFNITVNGKKFKAETIDYSAIGLGVVIEDSPDISPSDIIKLNIPDPDINKNGTIVWLKRASFGTMVGICFIDPIKGSLKDYRLSDIFIGLQRSGKTGVLEVKSGQILKKVYIKNGNMIFSASNQKTDWLGDILLAEGRINQQQYDKSVEVMKKTGKRQGGILVELGYLKPQELVTVVQHQVEHVILSLFAMKNGEFEFKEGPLPIEEVITLRLSAANIIYRGIIGVDSKLRSDVICIEESSVLCFSSDPLDLFQDIKLDDSGKSVISVVDGEKTIGDIIAGLPLDRNEIIKAIYALLSTRIIDIKEESLPIDINLEDIMSEHRYETSQEFVEKVEYMYNKYKELGYYGILDIDENTSLEDIKRAYYKTAKEYHPDRHFHFPQDMREKLSSIFTYVKEAYSTLINPEKRKEYDRRLFG